MSTVIDVGREIDTRPVSPLQWRTFGLCAAVLFVDGFDTQGITYVAPAISREWGLARGAMGPTFSAGLFGLMLGAALVAPLADRVGRRLVMAASCVAFGLGTLATVLVPSVDVLLVVRFVTGLGLGGALPNAIGLASEYAPTRRRASLVMFVSSGISLGSIGSGIAAARLVEVYGWRSLFVVGGLLPLALAVVLMKALPESLRFAALVPGRRAEALGLLRRLAPDLVVAEDVQLEARSEGGRATVGDLFLGGRAATTALLWVGFFMSLLNVYLAINWLPTSLNASGFTVAQAAVITSLYHVGGVLGTYAIGLLMDRLGIHAMLMTAALIAMTGFATFATVTGLAAVGTTVVLMAAGFGVIGAQVGITTLASVSYPVQMRSTGLGWALGVGRIGSIIGPTIGGWMLATQMDPRAMYIACVGPALIQLGAVALLRWGTRRIGLPGAPALRHG